MAETKKWYLSKGVIGGVVAASAGIFGLFGVGVPADVQGELVDKLPTTIEHVVAASAAVGGVVSIIGRIFASKKLSK